MSGSYREHLAALVRLFGSARRAADFIGVSHSQVTAWIRGSAPREKSVRQIADATAVVSHLRAHGLDDVEIVTTLNTTWPELEGRPGDLVREGKAADVVAAITVRYAPHARQLVAPGEPGLVDALLALAAAAQASAAALGQGVAS